MNLLLPERLRQVISYDEMEGTFVWRMSNSARAPIGSPAGGVTSYGYLAIRVDKRLYLAHRLAWLYVYGDWPEFVIDHINGNKLDNRISNLRDVRRQTNNENRKAANRNSKSGCLGVHWSRQQGMWQARLMINRRSVHVGFFREVSSARDAYFEAKKRIHEGFAQ